MLVHFLLKRASNLGSIPFKDATSRPLHTVGPHLIPVSPSLFTVGGGGTRSCDLWRPSPGVAAALRLQQEGHPAWLPAERQ